MNWEESKALTPLKRDFLKAFFDRGQPFFLTGGSALGIFYLQHRLSYDLDLFTTDEHIDWHVLDNETRSIAGAIGAQCETITAAPTFRRYDLTRGAEREIVDFVVEMVPQIDPEKERFDNLRVDTLREIMANKICTVIGRCEMKDLIDLFFLHRHGFDVRDHIAEANLKEGGLDPAMMSFILSQVVIDRVPDYLIAPLDLEDLRSFVRGLQIELAELAYPQVGENL
ncbi:MAG TPA: nucleotidyl transferase AbiEii/AbiGii toxin family protein [Armatimonadota bacterium]|nr:nucleotidyl transferase AbiEii/AbiGii toxin family protein [Armatimonadota bacterium]